MNTDPPATTSQLQKVGWLAVILVAGISVYAPFSQPPAVATDVGTYLLANATNSSRYPSVLTSVDPKDLSRDRHSPITWWPESYGGIPEFVQKSSSQIGFDLNIGQVIQWTTILGWLIGIALWYWFFKLVVPPKTLPWIFLIFLSARYSHANFYLYDGGEFFYWVLFPAVLVLNYKAVTSDQSTRRAVYFAAGAGAATPLLVLVKYSAGLSMVGFGVAWLWLGCTNRVRRRCFINWCVNAGTIAGFIIWLGLIPEGNPTQVDSPWQWTPIPWITGAWLFAMTDLGTLVNKFTLDVLPAMGSHQDGSEGWLFLPAAILLWWVLKSHFKTRAARLMEQQRLSNCSLLLIGHLLGFSAILLLLLVRGSAIHLDTRFLRPAAIAVMPLTLMTLWDVRLSSQRPLRFAAWLLLGMLAVIPSLYGLAALGHKTFIRSQYADALTDPVGLRHDVLSPGGSAVSFFHELSSITTTNDVIYLLEPTMGISVHQGRLFVEEHAHLRSKEVLASRSYHGTPAGKLYIPLPKTMVADGRAQAIQDSFKDISSWKEINMDSQPEWLLFIGE